MGTYICTYIHTYIKKRKGKNKKRHSSSSQLYCSGTTCHLVLRQEAMFYHFIYTIVLMRTMCMRSWFHAPDVYQNFHTYPWGLQGLRVHLSETLSEACGDWKSCIQWPQEPHSRTISKAFKAWQSAPSNPGSSENPQWGPQGLGNCAQWSSHMQELSLKPMGTGNLCQEAAISNLQYDPLVDGLLMEETTRTWHLPDLEEHRKMLKQKNKIQFQISRPSRSSKGDIDVDWIRNNTLEIYEMIAMKVKSNSRKL